jgi:hypothetical protein
MVIVRAGQRAARNRRIGRTLVKHTCQELVSN